MHAVPQPSVQRVEAAEVLGVQRLLPPDAGPAQVRRRARATSSRPSWSIRTFAGEGTAIPSEAIIFYELRNGLLQVGLSRVRRWHGDQQERLRLRGCDRRTELAKLIVKSPYLDKAIVNRMWEHFLGYGFTKPIDDMGPHNPPIASGAARLPGRGVPQEQLQPQGADPLDRAQRALFALQQGHAAATRRTIRCWARRRSSATSTCGRCGPKSCTNRCSSPPQAHKTRGSYEEQEKLKAEWLQQFTIAFGTDEGDEATTFNGTIPQALMMMNGDLIKKATSIEQGQLPAARSPPATSSRPTRSTTCSRPPWLAAHRSDEVDDRQRAAGRPQGRRRPRPCKTCGGPCSTATSSSCNTKSVR